MASFARARSSEPLARPVERMVSGQAQPSPSIGLAERSFTLGVGAAVAVGFLIRAVLVLPSGFPLNDGGLFYAMMGDLQAHGYRLPAYASYNGGDIAFAYPPLALYAGAALADLTPLTTLDVLRFLPLAVNTATIVAFALLARSVLGRSSAAVAATFAFALVPRSFLWMIMGGGLTRSFGFFFAVVGVWLTHRTLVLRDRRSALWLGLVGALAVLSHLEMALLLLVASAVIVAFHGRDRSLAAQLALSLGVTAVVTAPWWGVVTARHGFDPFLAAARSNGDFQRVGVALFGIASLRVTGELLFPVILLLGALGAVTKIARRDLLLPVWLVLAVLVDLRSFPMFAVLPVALLAGVGWTELSGLIRRAAAAGPAPLRTRPGSERLQRAIPALLVVTLVEYASISVLAAAQLTSPSALDSASREAMSWVAAETPPSSAFAVVSGEPQGWALDEVSEWFPALTGRRSVATVQGSEWLPPGVAGTRLEEYASLQRCAFRSADCLAEWSARWGIDFEYVYVARDRALDGYLEQFGFEECCSSLRDSLLGHPGYRLVYDGPGASVFEVVEQGARGRDAG